MMVRDPRKRIYLAVLNEGEIRVELASVINKALKNEKFIVTVDYATDKPIANNRNKIVKKFLDSGMDYLVQVDDDIIPPDDFLDMVLYDKDIMAPVMFAYRKEGLIPLTLRQREDGSYTTITTRENGGTVEVDAVGSGCLITPRRVLEDVKAPFLNEYDEEGIKERGLDIAFCRRAKERGWRVWGHLDYVCSHWTVLDQKQIYETIQDNKTEQVKLAGSDT